MLIFAEKKKAMEHLVHLQKKMVDPAVESRVVEAAAAKRKHDAVFEAPWRGIGLALTRRRKPARWLSSGAAAAERIDAFFLKVSLG